jgi:DNA-binding NarL/FixJ family response regulator
MESVLIIDDEASVLGVLSSTLSGKYDCQTAPDAETALEIMHGKEFAAVITDISLPGQSGIELLGTMRQNNPETPVIVISGIHDTAYAQGLIEMGAFGYLSKPLSLSDIDSMVARAIDSRRQGLNEGQKIRACRYELQIEARLSGVLVFDDQEDQGLVVVAGVTRDLSQTGAAVIVPAESLEVSRLVGQNFQLVLGMIEGSMALDAMVVRCEEMDPERYLIGARFTNLSGRDRMQLLLYLQAHRLPEEGENNASENGSE